MTVRLRALLCLLCIIASAATASASVRITDLRISEDPVSYMDEFEVTAKLTGDTCNMLAEYYIDRGPNMAPYRFDYNTVPCEADKVTGKLKLTGEEWEYYSLKCGQHTAWVELHVNVGNAIVANKSTNFDIGLVPNLEFTPSRPIADKESKVTLTDKVTGDAIPNVDVKIKDVYGGDPMDKKTDLGGSFVFTPKVAGEYKMIFLERDTCGETTFYAKRPLIIDGPRPENPVINEMVVVGVPSGAAVGVKILDANGNVYKNVPVTYSGGANFSISDPGTYVLLVGDNSTKYWSVNKTFVVSDRLQPEVAIAPSEPVVGKTATITVMSRGQPLPAATVTIKRPDGVDRDYTTSDYGTINYDGMSTTGTYTIKVTKDRYGVGTGSFEARHAFDVTFEPQYPTVKDPITLQAKDQNGKPVSDVLVEIPSNGFKRVTDMGGKVSFNLQEPQAYGIKLSKSLFWDRNIELTPYGILALGECLSEFELGGKITLSTFDSFGKPIEAEINIKDPSGIIQHKTGSTYEYTPAKPGAYAISVSRTNFIDANTTFKVLPHPIALAAEMKAGELIVNVTSNGNPLHGIAVSVNRDGQNMNGTTDASGQAAFSVTKEGNLTIAANAGRANVNYAEKTVKQRVVRSYDLVLLTTPLVLIFIITVVTIVAIQAGRVYFGGEWKMPSFSFGKPKMRTKHDSVLLGSDRSKKSRLSDR